MSQILMIVESPNKAKKIRGFYPNFQILTTVGHFRDLPPDKMGVEPPTHKPQYEILDGKQNVVKQIKDAAKNASTIYVATDPDREGEAIAAHVVNVLGKDHRQKISRITYTEVSKRAIDDAISNKRQINWKMVSAQELRRVIDRYVGYLISPELTRRLRKPGTQLKYSAGRVQSIALRLVVERDLERLNFTPREHYGVELTLEAKNTKFKALWKPELAKDTLMMDKGLAYQVKERTSKVQLSTISKRENDIAPPKPLITSDFLKLMSRQYKMSAKVAMDVAQRLFEQGLITYHRTDSHDMSADFAYTVREFALRNKLPLPDKPYQYKAGKNAQQGHECLRVTDINLINPRMVGVDDQQLINAYQLVWKYSLESQLNHGKNQIVRYEFINSVKDSFVSQSTRMTQAGWRHVAKRFIQELPDPDSENTDDEVAVLPELYSGDVINLLQADVLVKFTEKPAQFNESSLIETLEKMGIGRPSTYAQIIENLVDRNYVEREKHLKLQSTDIGKKVVETLKSRFSFLEYDYTAKMESDIDKVACGESDYLSIITAAYEALSAEVNVFRDSDAATSFRVTDGDNCPQCQVGKVAVMSFNNSSKKNSGRQFIGCSNFPTCKFFQWVQ